MSNVIDIMDWKKNNIKPDDYLSNIWKPLPLQRVNFNNDFIILKLLTFEKGNWCSSYMPIFNEESLKLVQQRMNDSTYIYWNTMSEIDYLLNDSNKPQPC